MIKVIDVNQYNQGIDDIISKIKEMERLPDEFMISYLENQLKSIIQVK